MTLEEEIAAARAAAEAQAREDEVVNGVVAAEPATGIRVYLCSFERGAERSWLALDRLGRPIADRALVRDAVSIAAMCEFAEESAGGGDVGALRARLGELRLTENPRGIEEAELAAAELEDAILSEPRVASGLYLDAIGQAARTLEEALGEVGGSPFAEAMKTATPAADELARDVERTYRAPLA